MTETAAREDYDAAIKRIVDAAPPLSQAQRGKLMTLLNDSSTLEPVQP